MAPAVIGPCRPPPQHPAQTTGTASQVISQTTDTAPQVVSHTMDTASQVLSQTTDTAPQVVSHTTDTAPQVLSQNTDTAPQVMSQTTDTAPQVTSQTKDTASQVLSQTTDTAPQVLSQTTDTAPQVVSQTTDTAPAASSSPVAVSICAVEEVWITHASQLMAKGYLNNDDNISWAAYCASGQRLLDRPPCVSAILSIFHAKASTPQMIYHAMSTIKAATDHLHHGQTPVITLDQPLCEIAKAIQWDPTTLFSSVLFIRRCCVKKDAWWDPQSE